MQGGLSAMAASGSCTSAHIQRRTGLRMGLSGLCAATLLCLQCLQAMHAAHLPLLHHLQLSKSVWPSPLLSSIRRDHAMAPCHQLYCYSNYCWLPGAGASGPVSGQKQPAGHGGLWARVPLLALPGPPRNRSGRAQAPSQGMTPI